MTLKASWFNLGIYTNTLRRFKWGSVLYFVMLFFMVPFMFLVNRYSYGYYRNYLTRGVVPQMILENDFMLLPLLTAYVVPIVVSVLVYRFMQENRQSIAVHSLPVTRRANYISGLLAGFTLMFLPVIANGLILLVMSVTGYGELFSPVTVLYWIILNMAILFIMFSVSTFAAFLTGHAAAHIAITLLLHLVPIAAALTIAFISEVFVYGFVHSDNYVAEILLNNAPFVWMFNRATNDPFINGFFGTLQFWVFLLFSIVLYIAGYFVYKIRKVEACGDVAAFKIVRHVLKYGVCAMVLIAVSAVSYEAELGLLTIIVINLVLGAIAYFATEMVLSKSLKVFGKYKGFIGFCAGAVCFICFFAFTSVFGYETRIPKVENIKSAAIYDYNHLIPLVEDEDFVRHVTGIHKEFIEKVPTVNPTKYGDETLYNMHVTYELKNGKQMQRRYYVPRHEYEAVLTSMYENETYKFKVEDLYYLNVDKTGGAKLIFRLNGRGTVYTYYFPQEDVGKLFEAYMNDTRRLSYSEITNTGTSYYNIEVVTRNEKDEYIKGILDPKAEKAYEYIPHSFDFSFNENYTETMAFLKESGHYDNTIREIAEDLYICKLPIKIEKNKVYGEMVVYEQIYSYKEDTGSLHQFEVALSDCIKIEGDDALRYAQSIVENSAEESLENGEYYAVFSISNSEEIDRISMQSWVKMINADNVPDYLKKYVE